MVDSVGSLAGQVFGAIVILGGCWIVLGIPFAIWEAIFGPIGGGGGGDGPYRSDRAAQELYQRRLRDSHRR